MNDDNTPGRRGGGSPGHLPAAQVLRLLTQFTVIAGVLALAAAAFALSYPGMRDIARAAGIPAGLARFYAALPDAVLVVACVAALALRSARWWARWLVWLSIIALAALVGAADAVHAMTINLPRRPAEAAVAVLPWVLLLLDFRLCLSVLRHPPEQAPIASLAVTGPAVASPVPASRASASAASGSPASESAASDNAVPGTTAGGSAMRGSAADSSAMHGSAIDGSAIDGSATPGGPSYSGTLMAPGLILPHYPNEPRETVDGALPERAADREFEPSSEGAPEHAAVQDHEPEPGISAPSFSAMVQETGVLERALRAGEAPVAGSAECWSPQLDAAAPAQAAGPGQAAGPAAEPERREPDTWEREPVQSAASVPDAPESWGPEPDAVHAASRAPDAEGAACDSRQVRSFPISPRT